MLNIYRENINWGAIALRGVAAVIFGMLALSMPGITLAAIVLLFGVYAIVDGVCALASMRHLPARSSNWWTLLAGGVVSIIAGLVTFAWPGITAIALLYLIAARAIVTGATEIVAAFRLHDRLPGVWSLGIAGAISCVFGVLMMLFPLAGAVAMAWAIGAYAIVFGVVAVAVGISERAEERRAPVVEVTKRERAASETMTPRV